MITAALLVAHGTRVDAADTEAATLTHLVAERTGVPTRLGWLELRRPDALAAAETLIAEGARRLVILPVLAFEAYHATVDVPRVAELLRLRHPDVRVRVARPLGLDARLVAAAAQQVRAATADPPREGLLVVATGSSDADAQAAAATAARMVAEASGHRRVQHGFVSLAAPDVPTAVRALVAAGAERVVGFAWSLFPGELIARARHAAETAAGRVPVVWAGRLGTSAAVADVLARRFLEVR